MCTKSLSRVWFFAISQNAACQVPLSMGILQARILEWVAMPSSWGPSQSRHGTHISSTGRQGSLPMAPPTGKDEPGLKPRLELFISKLSDSLPPHAAQHASLSFIISQSLLKLKIIELMMPSNHLILCRLLLLLPSVFPSVWAFSGESALPIRWPKYWSFSFSISPFKEYSVAFL